MQPGVENGTYKLGADCDLDKPFADTILVHGYSDDLAKAYLKQRIPAADEDVIKAMTAEFHKFYNAPVITILASGVTNYSGSTKGLNGNGATAALGAGISLKNGKRLTLMYTVAETRDTITSQEISDFGQTILVPGLRKFSILINWRDLHSSCLERLFKTTGVGVGVFVNMSPMIWKRYTASSVNSTALDSLPKVVNVSPITMEAYLSYTMVENSEASNPYRLTFDLGLSSRFLGGDQLSDTEHDMFLGTTQDWFPGLVLGIDFHFGGTQLYSYMTLLDPDKAGVNGLTGLQLHGGLSLSASLVSSKK